MNPYYLLAFLASVGFASQFAAMKLYQKNTENNLSSSLVFSIIVAGITAVFFFAVNGFQLRATLLTILLSMALGIIGVVSTINSIKILSYGKMSVYSMFMMLGGMALPAVFGIIAFSEQATDFKIVGMIVLVLSLVLSSKEKQSGTQGKVAGVFYLLCLLAFTLNGSNSVLSNIQGKGWVEGANNMVWGMEVTGLYDFMVWTRVFNVFFGLLVFPVVFLKPKEQRVAELQSVKKIFRKQPLFATLLFTLISVAAFVCQQVCTPHIDASALYPITTGGTVVLSTIYGRVFYKEKTSAFIWMCVGLTTVATILFMVGDILPTTWIAGLFS